MNKKVLGIALASIFLAMLVAPAIAGKGQSRVDFKFVLVGMYGGLPAEILEHGMATHYFDIPFVATGWMGDTEYPTPYAALTLEIDGVPIPAEQLSYSGMITTARGSEYGGGVVTVSETIIITVDDVEMGTLELKVHGNTNSGNGVGNGDGFIGFGTGAYEGVKIEGRSPGGAVQVGEMDIGGGNILGVYKLERVGTVMGWP